MNNHLILVDAKSFGAKIKEQRIKSGKSLTEMAKLIELPKSSLSYYENGKAVPSLDKTYQIAKALHLSIDYLVGNTTEPNQASHVIDELMCEYQVPRWKVESILSLINK